MVAGADDDGAGDVAYICADRFLATGDEADAPLPLADDLSGGEAAAAGDVALASGSGGGGGRENAAAGGGGGGGNSAVSAALRT